MRLIDADALREGIACHKQYTDQEYETDRQWAFGYNAGIERALFSITCAHTIDAEPVRNGRWGEEGGYNVCSVCGEAVDRYDDGGYLQDFAYCPNCGAKMDGGEEDESV